MGANWRKAKDAGFNVKSVSAASKSADIVVLLAPDTYQPAIYHEHIVNNLVAGNALMFSHGFNIHYGQIKPACGRGCVHGCSQGSRAHGKGPVCRRRSGVPGACCQYTRIRPAKLRILRLPMPSAIGCARAGVIETIIQG